MTTGTAKESLLGESVILLGERVKYCKVTGYNSRFSIYMYTHNNNKHISITIMKSIGDSIQISFMVSDNKEIPNQDIEYYKSRNDML